jgi:hypothetical protein
MQSPPALSCRPDFRLKMRYHWRVASREVSMATGGWLRTASLAAAVLAAFPASALADGGRGRAKHGFDRHYDGGYYAPHRYRHRHYDDRRPRGRISGGEAVLIAAGVIGGVILIDQALDSREREYDDRYRDQDRYGNDDPYYTRDDRYGEPYNDRSYGADGGYSNPDHGDDYGLDGGPDDVRDVRPGDGADLRAAAAGAFRECVAETRGAAGAGGLIAAFPSEPDRVDPRGRGWRMEASFRATNPRGASWSRRMICEADDSGVRFLQVD